MTTFCIKIMGKVQGVGFRPFVWHLAYEYKLVGEVYNSAEGVFVLVQTTQEKLISFIAHIGAKAPSVSHIEHLEYKEIKTTTIYSDFVISASEKGKANTSISPDLATCEHCQQDIFDPTNRRYLYPFATCMHCGPRYSIVEKIPYDRQNTTMSVFAMCEHCSGEYSNPSDRRFHAQPNACSACGPTLFLDESSHDELSQIEQYLKQGKIVAIKGIGGFHLACDATNTSAVNTLRHKKQRYAKPFALMARDIEVIRKYALVPSVASVLLHSPQAPIVLLKRHENDNLAKGVADNLAEVGFMLPYAPLHHLLLQNIDFPVVLTSANISDEPQCIDNQIAQEQLESIAEHILSHNRTIVQRVDDSVARIINNRPQIMRLSRGYAPHMQTIPKGFEALPSILACGAELKNGFCLSLPNKIILSEYIGDLKKFAVFEEYKQKITHYQNLYSLHPKLIVCDKHEGYYSSVFAKEYGQKNNIPLTQVAHHYAHFVSCMVDNALPKSHPKIIGVVLDGLGLGENNELWGGEFFIGNYEGYERVGTFKSVGLAGLDKAGKEPWRNLLSHLEAKLTFAHIYTKYPSLEAVQQLQDKPYQMMLQVLSKEHLSPKVSSVGRLFDAVAASLGICFDQLQYEGQAAMELEALVDEDILHQESDVLAYPFLIVKDDLPYVEPCSMWERLFADLANGEARSTIATRFHKGLAMSIVQMVQLVSKGKIKEVSLSGGVMQNKVLVEQITVRLEEQNFQVYTHHIIPAGDQGVCVGQVFGVIARLDRLKHGKNSSKPTKTSIAKDATQPQTNIDRVK